MGNVHKTSMRHTAGIQRYDALLDLRVLCQMGIGGPLRSAVRLPGFFEGSVNGFAVFPVLPCGTLRAHVVAVLIIIWLGYAAAFQELFRSLSATFMRLDGQRHGHHRVADVHFGFSTNILRNIGSKQCPQKVRSRSCWHSLINDGLCRIPLLGHRTQEQATCNPQNRAAGNRAGCSLPNTRVTVRWKHLAFSRGVSKQSEICFKEVFEIHGLQSCNIYRYIERFGFAPYFYGV